MHLLDLCTLTAAGLMIGNEFAIAAFVHPALTRLEDGAHLPAASALAQVLGRWMPFWYGGVLLLLIAELAGHWQMMVVRNLLLGSALLWAAVIVVTIFALVPVNNRIAAANRPATAPFDWKADRRRWDSLHRGRVFLLLIAYLLALAALVR